MIPVCRIGEGGVVGVAGNAGQKPRQIAPPLGIAPLTQDLHRMGQVIAQGQRVGNNRLVCRGRLGWDKGRQIGQFGQHPHQGGAKGGETFQRLVDKPIRARRQRRRPARRVARGGQHRPGPPRPLNEIANQRFPPPVGQAEVDQHDIGTIQLQMQMRAAQILGPAQAQPQLAAHQAQCLRGETAVFHRQQGQTAPGHGTAQGGVIFKGEGAGNGAVGIG